MRQQRLKPALQRLLFFSLILGLLLGGWRIGERLLQERRKRDPDYHLLQIAQKSSRREKLPNRYFEELLDLSTDRPVNLYSFDEKSAKKKLLSSPYIRKARVKKIPPNLLYLEYSMRKPLAFVADFQQTACDSEGALFSLEPFYTPKELPQLYFGIAPDERLEPRQIRLANELIGLFSKPGLKLRWLDLSSSKSESSGKREIVLMLEERREEEGALVKMPIFLRISPDRCREAAFCYELCRPHLLLLSRAALASERGDEKKRQIELEEEFILIDLRTPGMGLIKMKEMPCSNL